MHGPLLFLSVFPVHRTQWGLLGHYCRAAGYSYSNVPISSESHYTMVCLLTINFQTNCCLEIFIILVGKHFSLLPTPLLSFLPQPPLLVPPPASTPDSGCVSLYFLLPFMPLSLLPILAPYWHHNALSCPLSPQELFWPMCILQPHLLSTLQSSFLSLSPEIGNGGGCAWAVGRSFWRNKWIQLIARELGQLNSRSLNNVHLLSSCVLKAHLLASCVRRIHFSHLEVREMRKDLFYIYFIYLQQYSC